MKWFCRRLAAVAQAYFLACLFAAGMLCASDSSSAAPLNYTADGGTSVISGTVGSLAFTNATWVLTATADPSTVLSGTLQFGMSNLPTYFLPASVTLQIADSVNGTTTMTLLNYLGGTWGVLSADYSSLLGAGAGALGFGAFNTSAEPWQISSQAAEFGLVTGGGFGGTAGAYNNLGTPGIWLGGQASAPVTSEYLVTSLGTMSWSATTDGISSGSFTIAAVPEPSTYAMALAGIACAGFRMFRHRKRT
jgi:hypothetical protein